jgi:hypothetical protein
MEYIVILIEFLAGAGFGYALGRYRRLTNKQSIDLLFNKPASHWRG